MDVDMEGVQVVELPMMDKKKYFTLGALCATNMRFILYPFSLVKTRLQIQKHAEAYTGTFDAFRKIVKFEGFRGLYRGFLVSNLLIVPQMTYITTYETVRQLLADHTSISNPKVRAFFGGLCASSAGQTFIVPIDVISQHLMLLGNTGKGGLKPLAGAGKNALVLPPEAFKTRLGPTKHVIKGVYQRDGLKGFYKGYFCSITVYAPNSAIWWAAYSTYCTFFASFLPQFIPRLVIQCLSAPFAGMTATVITNPMDIVRARMQVENTKFAVTAKSLWEEERLGMFKKGLTARLCQSIIVSFFIVLGYETIKRWSLKEEYKEKVRW